MNRASTLSAVAGLAALPTISFGQLYVDYGGPRNIFSQPTSSTTSSSQNGTAGGGAAAATTSPADSSLNFFNFDSQKEQVGLNFLNLGRWPTMSPLVWGGTLTIASPNNDPTEILKFHESPTITGSVLANWTTVSRSTESNWASSFTFDASNAYNGYTMVPSATATKSTTKDVNEPSFSVCFAYAWGPAKKYLQDAVAITVGIARSDNYQSLPQVNLANSQTARIGPLAEFASYPVKLLYVHTVSVNVDTSKDNVWDGILKAAGFQKGNCWLELAPYFNIAPRQGGAPSDGVGFNVALATVKADPIPSKSKLSYPWSVYIEYDKKYDTTHYVTQAGVSKVFAF